MRVLLMHVVAFYYLSYPEESTGDPTFASTKMYVEVGEEGDSSDCFSDTFVFDVYTFRYVQECYLAKGKCFFGKAVLVVPTLDEKWMLDFLDENITELLNIGEPH